MATVDPDIERLEAEADDLLAKPDLCPNARRLVKQCQRILATLGRDEGVGA